MRVTGQIFTLDLGNTTGFAAGAPGDKPTSGIVILKASSEKIDVAFSNLIVFLQEQFEARRPQLVVKEQMLPLEAFMALGNAERTVRAHAGFHAIVEAMCKRYSIDWDEKSDATIRKHFIGKGRLGTRKETKDAVINRCHLLGLMPRDCDDDNRADALAIHDWACATYGAHSASIQNFQLFGQEREQQSARGGAEHASG